LIVTIDVSLIEIARKNINLSLIFESVSGHIQMLDGCEEGVAVPAFTKIGSAHVASRNSPTKWQPHPDTSSDSE
jgi:hypothetical protein